MSRGWYGNSQKHSLASRGIKTKNNTNIRRGKIINIFDVMNYLRSTNFKKEIGLVVDEKFKVLDYNVGDKDVVYLRYKKGVKNQTVYHIHPMNARPSITDIYIFLTIPLIKESWVVTPDYVYIMSAKKKNNSSKNKDFEEFEKNIYDKIAKKYGDEFLEKYKSLSSEKQTPIFEKELHKYVISDDFKISKYKFDGKSDMNKIMEMN